MNSLHPAIGYLSILLAALSGGIGNAHAEMSPPHCAPASITCVAIDGIKGQIQHDVPITFGQPFVVADVPHGSVLVATDAEGNLLPVQIDQISSHPDGSVRFAIVTTSLPELKDHESISLSLRQSGGATQAAALNAAGLLATGYDLRVDIALHSPQVTQIVLGDRDGSKSGVPFIEGEIVGITLGDDPRDRYSVTVTHEMAGGDFATLTKLAEAIAAEINKGHRFRADKFGEGGGYEKIWVTTRDSPDSAFTMGFIYAGRAKLASHNLQSWAPTRRYFASVGSALAKAGASPETWLKGPVATEFSLAMPLRDTETGAPQPRLNARFDLRAFAGSQRVRTDVVLENDWAYEAAPGNVSYDIAVTEKNAAVYQASNVGLYQHARWHKVIWSGGPVPVAGVRYDVPYFLKSRMVWNYDASVHVSEPALAREAKLLAAADTGPTGPAFITQYMPMTGGRDDIGPLPRWTALYLLSQDSRARAAMLANADASGGIPIHYRDRPTDQPVNLDRHPGIAMLFGKAAGKDALPEVTNGDTPWTPDAAHQPSLAYVPYLITGDRFYLDELLFWANWDMGGVDPSYREGAKGLVHWNQIRGQAWSMRTLGEAALALPDDHPMKAYFAQKLQNNLQWYVDNYPRNRNHELISPLGWIERPDVPGSTAPWQDDFLALVMGHLAEAGYPLAEEFFRWQAQSTVGRWTHEAEGYCRTMAPAYYIIVRVKSGSAIRDWRTLMHENWPELGACPARFPEGSYPDEPAGYVAYSQAMLALSSDFRIPGAGEAFHTLHAESPALARALAEDPSWAIAPRNESYQKADKP